MTDFLSRIPDPWMLLSIVQQHPAGISSFRLAEIATGAAAPTGVAHEVRVRMLAHRQHGRVAVLSSGTGDVIYKPRPARP